MTPEQAAALRAPFEPHQIGKLPKAGITLDYVGHAAVTDRLLQVDPLWSWEPLAYGEAGTPLVLADGKNAVLWIRLTVCDVTRLGVGIVQSGAFELQKQLISDALRNAAMRFGVALDLWSKEDLGEQQAAPEGVDVATGEIAAGGEARPFNSADPGATGESRNAGHGTPAAPKSATGVDPIWDNFLANPNGWWDNRNDKRSPRAPDFKAKKDNPIKPDGLWLDGLKKRHGGEEPPEVYEYLQQNNSLGHPVGEWPLPVVCGYVELMLTTPPAPKPDRIATLRKDSDAAAEEFVG